MGWLIGILIYIILVFLQVAWEYRGNIQLYIYKPETRRKKGKIESEKDFY